MPVKVRDSKFADIVGAPINAIEKKVAKRNKLIAKSAALDSAIPLRNEHRQQKPEKWQQRREAAVEAVKKVGRNPANAVRAHAQATKQGYHEGLSGTETNDGAIQQQINRVSRAGGRKLSQPMQNRQAKKRIRALRQAQNRRGVV